MKQKEKTKEQIVETLKTIYEMSGNSSTFFDFLGVYGIETYLQNGKIEGVLIDGNKASLDSLGYPNEAIQELDYFMSKDAGHTLIERSPSGAGDGQLRASDIVPDFEQLEEALGTPKASEREEELDDIRDGKEEEKGIEKGPDR